MKKFSKKGVLLFAAVMALCAFAMPSMASASSWGPANSHQQLTSTNTGFVSDLLSLTSMCSSSQFTADVISSADLQITQASFTGCTAVGVPGQFGLCTATAAPTKLPWTATAVTTSNLQIHGINIDVTFENHPGGSACLAAGQSITITGTLSGARWTGNTRHGLDLEGATGLVSHSPVFGNGVPVTPTGTLGATGLNQLTVT